MSKKEKNFDEMTLEELIAAEPPEDDDVRYSDWIIEIGDRWMDFTGMVDTKVELEDEINKLKQEIGRLKRHYHTNNKVVCEIK